MTTAPPAGATTTPAPGQPPAQPSPFASRWWIASAAVVGLVLATLVTLLLLPAPEEPLRRPSLDRPATAPAVGGSSCGLAGGEQTPPAVAPTDPTFGWHLVGTMAAPTAPAVGPGSSLPVPVQGPAGEATVEVPVCYSPDPWGAVFAAYGFVATHSTPGLRLASAQVLVAEGPGKEAALADLAAGDVGSRSTGVQLAGFRFLDYLPGQSATLDLAAVVGGGYRHFTLDMVWTGGDWRVVLPVTGSPYAGAGPLPSLAGYVPFRGA